MNLEEKKRITQDLSERFNRAAVVIVTDYKGLDVDAINDLRRRLRKADVEYQVVKNSLLVRASQDTDVAKIQDTFKGPSAVVLTEFAKDKAVFKIKIGIADGKIIELKEIVALAALPSREILLGRFLSVLNNVPTGFVRTLAEIPRRLLNVLQAIQEQKEAV